MAWRVAFYPFRDHLQRGAESNKIKQKSTLQKKDCGAVWAATVVDSKSHTEAE
jgi:hypothetical protein